MKVKVRAIAFPYTQVPTSSLQSILRNHAHNKLLVQIGTNQLYAIMGELVKRREQSGTPFRSDMEALADLYRRCYLEFYSALCAEKARLEGIKVPHTLTPSFHGKECLGNGEWPGYECQCPDCDWYLECFPEDQL